LLTWCWKAGLAFVEAPQEEPAALVEHLISWCISSTRFDSTSSRMVDSFALIGIKIYYEGSLIDL
jgi:hypothetical protein